jgi:hypothetical protein
MRLYAVAHLLERLAPCGCMARTDGALPGRPAHLPYNAQ